MKANELMIGDWVFNKYTNNAIQVYPMMFSQMFRQKPDAITEDYNIYPIPLTLEILEKNGLIDNWHYDEYWMSYSKHDEEWYFHFYGAFAEMKVSISYLHELQHALRLCGIEKEIVL